MDSGEAADARLHAPDDPGAPDHAERAVDSPVNEDYRDILTALIARDARFLIVGAHALAAHGYPRATVDIDIWIDATPENAARVWRALADFGALLSALDVLEADLTRPDVVAQFGLAPKRIDILTGVSGVTFAQAWENRIDELVEGVRVPVMSLKDLIANKRASGRDRDRADIKGLEGKS